ncbi:MAG: hypothetical protein AAGF04_00070 [Chlamydiota bacterium]
MSVELDSKKLTPLSYCSGTASAAGIAAATYFAWQAYTITAVALGVLSAVSLIVTVALRDTNGLTQGSKAADLDTSGKIQITTERLNRNVNKTIYNVIDNSLGFIFELIADCAIFKPCELLTRATINLITSTPKAVVDLDGKSS